MHSHMYLSWVKPTRVEWHAMNSTLHHSIEGYLNTFLSDSVVWHSTHCPSEETQSYIHSMLLSNCSTLQSVRHTSALCARWRGVGEWAQHERNVMLGRLLQVKHNLQSIEAHSSFLSLEFLLKQFMMATHNMWEHTCRKVGFMETALKLYFTEYSSNTRSMEHNNFINASSKNFHWLNCDDCQTSSWCS